MNHLWWLGYIILRVEACLDSMLLNDFVHSLEKDWSRQFRFRGLDSFIKLSFRWFRLRGIDYFTRLSYSESRLRGRDSFTRLRSLSGSSPCRETGLSLLNLLKTLSIVFIC
jgi:hypothetical protein